MRSRGGVVPGIVCPLILAGRGLFVDSVEDPEYVKEHNISLDVDYYINKQILPPVERILREFGVEYATLNYDSKQKGLFDFGIGTVKSVTVQRKRPVKKATVQQALF